MREGGIYVAILALLMAAPAKSQFVLDAGVEREDSVGGVFKDARKALTSLPDGTEDEPTILTVRPGVYWLDDPDDSEDRQPLPGDGAIPYALTLSAKHIVIRGSDADARNTVFAVNRGQTQGANGNFTMLKVTGTDIAVENVTFGNYCNVDLEYDLRPELSRKKRADAIVQAQIAICYGSDKMYFKNCRFISRLNLNPFVNARRAVYDGCYFECTDDALTGQAIYRDCQFTFYSSKPFYNTSETGAIFVNCDIESKVQGTQYLTKAGGAVTMIDTRIVGSGIKNIEWSKGDEDYTCYVDNVTLNGKPVTIDPKRPWRTVSKRIDTKGIMAGNDGWNPAGEDSAVASPTTIIVTPSRKRAHAPADSIGLRVRTLLWGGYVVSDTTEQIMLSNESWMETEERIVREGKDGLRGSALIKIEGKKHEAPQMTSGPLLTMHDNAVWLTYDMTEADVQERDGQEDVSLVTWYRMTETGDTIATMESRTNKRIYYPTAADAGKRIGVRIIPQRRSTEAGESIWAEMQLPDRVRATKGFTCDFSTTPIRQRTDTTLRDVWLMDTHKPADTEEYEWKAESDEEHPAWRYGYGVDGAQESRGLVTECRGARLTYIPERDSCKKMTARIKIDPCKSGGQGFGSATGQYLDVMLKFDHRTQTGWGLRIERSPQYDKAVVLTPMRYENDRGYAVGDTAVTKLFKAGCEVAVIVSPEGINAGVAMPSTEGLTAVRGEVKSSGCTGLRIQHTGSVGQNALVIKSLLVMYE